ncbi:MAG: hypothetical protein JXR76_11730 [Deltaproteobacteria bacterium]|nr:hypothetical protein [Deltaproteobacteria bacterium]
MLLNRVLNLIPVPGVVLLLLLTGCTTFENEATDSKAWTHGLSQKQIVEAMPVVAQTVNGSQQPQGAIAVRRAVGERPSHLVSWMVPHDSLRPASWEVYEKNNNDEWEFINVTIETRNREEDDIVYDVFSFTTPVGDTVSFIKYYKIVMVDHNGASYGSIVSLVSYPGGHPIAVTLADETEADAPSGVTLHYNGVEESLWDIQRLESLDLPQTVNLDANWEAWSDLQLTIQSDFSGWGLGDLPMLRASNSSFCKVELVTAPAGPIVARLKFSFEDLPLNRVANEPTKAFDYNDVVLFVDILTPEMSTEVGQLLWARDSAGSNNDYTWDTAGFSDGSAVAVGMFNGPITFGEGEVNEVRFNDNWEGAGFISRYTPEGDLMWARDAKHVAWRSVAGLADGSIIVAGNFYGPIILGKGEPNETTLQSQWWSKDGVIAKFDMSGQLVWASQITGAGAEYVEEIKTFANGDFAVGGFYYDDIHFNAPGGVYQFPLSAASGSDGYVARYAGNGVPKWARVLNPTAGSSYPNIATFADGSMTVSENFHGELTIHDITLNAGEYENSYLISYDAAGNIVWAKTIGAVRVYSAASTSDHGTLLAGYFYNTVTLGAGEPNETTLVGDASAQAFVAKFNDSGALLWAKQAGGAAINDYAIDVATFGDDSFALTGFFYCNQPAVFGAGEINETVLTSAGSYDMFLATYQANGTLNWALNEGNVSHELGYAVATTGADYILTAGRIESYEVTFGEGDAHETTLIGLYNGDMFIAKYAR